MGRQELPQLVERDSLILMLKKQVELSNLLLCNNFCDTLLIFPFSFEWCEFVVLYIILLEVACNLSRFCKMARRSKVVGPGWFKSFSFVAVSVF